MHINDGHDTHVRQGSLWLQEQISNHGGPLIHPLRPSSLPPATQLR